jgi:hypothetical protein
LHFAERKAARKQHDHLFRRLGKSEITDHSAVDSSRLLVKLKSHSPTQQQTKFGKAEKSYIEAEDDNSDNGSFKEYDDMIYTERDYLQDDILQHQEANVVLESTSWKGSEKPSYGMTDSSFDGFQGEGETQSGSTIPTSIFDSESERRQGEKLSSDDKNQPPSFVDELLLEDHTKKEDSQLREQQEKVLLQKLMDGYERDVRPVINASHPVVIRVGITLTQIFDMVSQVGSRNFTFLLSFYSSTSCSDII